MDVAAVPVLLKYSLLLVLGRLNLARRIIHPGQSDLYMIPLNIGLIVNIAVN